MNCDSCVFYKLGINELYVRWLLPVYRCACNITREGILRYIDVLVLSAGMIIKHWTFNPIYIYE